MNPSSPRRSLSRRQAAVLVIGAALYALLFVLGSQIEQTGSVSAGRTALRFAGALMFTPGELDIASGKLISFDGIKVVLDVIVASLFAVVMGGTETALIMAGPVGLIIGAALGLLVAFVGSQAADRKLRTVNLPRSVRRLFSEKRFHAGMERKQEEFAFAIFDQLMADMAQSKPEITQMIDDIADCLETQLRDMLNKAIMLIR